MSSVPDRNIVLTGFMGTGKTTVGRQVAQRLGRTFVDLDDVIVQRAGKTIPEIFDQDGETVFRGHESTVCSELGHPAGLVIATGGGAILDPANRDALMAGGEVICLDADPSVIVARLAGGNGRPLLGVMDPQARVADLLAQRRAVYAALANHVDTSRLSAAAVAERVMAVAAGLPAGAYRLPDLGYDIIVAGGVIGQAGKRIIAAGLRQGRCAVITNPTVAAHHAASLVESLSESGLEPFLYEVPDGEEYKTLSTTGTLYSRLAADKMSRGEPIIALGGGVIGDLAGFVSATWLRGVPFVQIPTSLLAMVDASIGGKVAVDLPQGKNLVGAFKQPVLVLGDPGLLRTLPPAEFRAGLAEIVKAALIGDAALFEEIAAAGPASLESVISDALRVKVKVVQRDPFEAGERAWLNLGHTFGHGLELVSGFRLRHGQAVALGLVAAAEMSATLGHCDRALPVRVRHMIERLGLPTSYNFNTDEVMAAMGTDKKRRGRSLRFVLLKRVGEVAMVDDVPDAAVLDALGRIRKEGV